MMTDHGHAPEAQIVGLRFLILALCEAAAVPPEQVIAAAERLVTEHRPNEAAAVRSWLADLSLDIAPPEPR